MFTAYALQSIHKNYIYKGFTSNLKDRFKRHNEGREKTTAHYRPFKIIYTKEFSNRKNARDHEKWLKSSASREFLKQISTKLKLL
ncbi:GIY-YIG nuclease family protein [Marivirga sp.]|uniref:GIY-YIG nuclease family protein n=1 Tax=Marivirga sp. TaxID=2018662 RepID=UPI003DA77C17